MENQEWISVRKRKPEPNQLVIIAHVSDSEDAGWVCAGQLQVLNRYSKKWYNQFESFEGQDSSYFTL